MEVGCLECHMSSMTSEYYDVGSLIVSPVEAVATIRDTLPDYRVLQSFQSL